MGVVEETQKEAKNSVARLFHSGGAHRMIKHCLSGCGPTCTITRVVSYALTDVFAHGAQVRDESGEVDLGREGVAQDGAHNLRSTNDFKMMNAPKRAEGRYLRRRKSNHPREELLNPVGRNWEAILFEKR